MTARPSDPWPGLETVGLATVVRRRLALVRRTDGLGTATGRVWLDGRRDEVWAGDAFIGGNVVKPHVPSAMAPRRCSRPTRPTVSPRRSPRFDPATRHGPA